MEITVLQTSSTHRATKIIDQKCVSVEPYNAGKYFRFYEATFNRWSELEHTLNRIADNDKQFIVLGTPVPETLDGKPHRRLKHERDGDKPTLIAGTSYVLPLDVDGFKVPGFTAAEDPLECIQAVLNVLGEPFASSTVWYSFTSSQKPYTDNDGYSSLRLRLIFLLKEPWSLCGMKIWARSQDPALSLDASIYSGAQPIYLARPIIQGGGGDPLPTRYRLIQGEKDLVDLQELKIPEFAGSSTRFSGVWLDDDQSALDLIGDNLPGVGCYQGMLHATWHLVRQHGKTIDNDQIKVMVRQKAANTEWDASKHPPQYVERVVSDPSLDSMILGAREKLHAQQKLFEGLEPDRNPKVMTLNQAKKKLRQFVQEVVSAKAA